MIRLVCAENLVTANGRPENEGFKLYRMVAGKNGEIIPVKEFRSLLTRCQRLLEKVSVYLEPAFTGSGCTQVH